MRLLDRYIIAEQLKVFSISVFILLSVLLLEKLNFLSGLLLTKGASFGTIGKMLLYISPSFLILAMPLAALMSSLIVFSRMSAENEITAMRANGISMYRLFMPVAIVGVSAFIVTQYLAVGLEHVGASKFREMVIYVLKANLNLEIKERRFNESFAGLLLYVDQNKDGKLSGVFISDQREADKPRIIEARRGLTSYIPDKEMAAIDLLDGVIHTLGKSGIYQTIAFDSYTLRIPLADKSGEPVEKEIPQLSLSELYDRIGKLKDDGKPAYAEWVAVHKKFSAPIGCVVLALLGAPLGVMTHRRGSAGGFGLGVVVIVINYVLWMFGQGLGSEGKLPPLLAIWAPNVIMGFVAAYFIERVSKDTMPTRLDTLLSDVIRFLRKNP